MASASEHEYLERIATEHDEKADNLFTDIANDKFTDEGKADATTEAQAHRRAAEIIRYQIECEA